VQVQVASTVLDADVVIGEREVQKIHDV
jgi:hypothetical protein